MMRTLKAWRRKELRERDDENSQGLKKKGVEREREMMRG